MFVNSVFLFDDKIVIVYNYGHNPNGGGDKVKSELPLKEIAESSDIASIGVPNKNLKVDRNLEVFALYFGFK